MGTTLKDIAREAQVAVSTVSYVLAGRGDAMKISHGTQENVRELARRMNYRGNSIARSLRQRSTKVIGVVMNDLTSSWASNVMASIDQVLMAQGFQPLLGISMFNQQREEQLIDSFINLQVDGLIIQPVSSSVDFYRHLLATTKVPVVFIGDSLEGIEVSSFTLDSLRAGRDQIDHLYALGHRRIAYVSTDYDSVQCRLRSAGVAGRLRELGLELPPEYTCKTHNMSPSTDRERALALLSCRPEPTAIAVFGDSIAIQVLGALRSVGRPDIAVIGIGDLPESSHELISLSTVQEPLVEFGAGAAAHLLRIIAGEEPQSSAGTRLYHGQLFARQSTLGVAVLHE